MAGMYLLDQAWRAAGVCSHRNPCSLVVEEISVTKEYTSHTHLTISRYFGSKPAQFPAWWVRTSPLPSHSLASSSLSALVNEHHLDIVA
jgi:hypothetical protein